MLIVNGSTPTSVADVSGNLLDGDGMPGGKHVAILCGFVFDKPGVPFNRLIREQVLANEVQGSDVSDVRKG